MDKRRLERATAYAHLVRAGWRPPVMSDSKLDELLDHLRAAPLVPEGLTGRERDVLGCAAQGLNADETARRLGVSRNTVLHHRKNAIAELGARTLPHAVALYMTAVRQEADAAPS